MAPVNVPPPAQPVFGYPAVGVHAKHVAALGEQQDIERVGPAVAHHRIGARLRTVGLLAVVDEAEIQRGAEGALRHHSSLVMVA